jgi:N-acetylmuramoyl-L-alanine amidase
MRSLQSFLLVLFLSGVSLCAGPVPPAELQAAAGGFTPLSSWAEENGFKLVTPGKDGGIALTNRSDRLWFKANSMLAEINGVHVWLCNAITVLAGKPCISVMDLRATIAPILYPAGNGAGRSAKTICLDPGHGGKDTGGVSGKYMEKHYTLPLAEEVAGQLRTAGFRVLLTRTNDTFIELEDRPALANREKADLFISLHFNIGPLGQAKGVEVFCLSPAESSSTNDKGRHVELNASPGNRQDPQNTLLAYQLQRALVTGLGAEDRGMRRARFEVLRFTTMPAVLIEGGFLSDADEQKKIADPAYRSRLAAAIVEGIQNYERLMENFKPVPKIS